MKIFNFSLLFLFVFAAIITSCTKDGALDQLNVAENTKTEVKGHILLPSEIIKQGETVINDYVSGLSIGDYTVHQNAYIIMKYLQTLELENQFVDHILIGNFQNVDFSKHLNESQIAELKNSLVEEIVETGELETRAQCCSTYMAPYCYRWSYLGNSYLYCCCEELVTYCYNCPGAGPY